MMENKILNNVKFVSLTKDNWDLFEELMGEKGGCGGCWCMLFRLSYKEFLSNKYEGNKDMMREIVCDGRPTGMMAIYKNKAVGWIALAPREDYIKIEKSRTLKRVDDKPVWSITCFFIKKEFRRIGLSHKMIQAVIEYAGKNNIKILEAYPVIPYAEKVPPPFLWVGILSAFTSNGFVVLKQNGKSKTMVRKLIS